MNLPLTEEEVRMLRAVIDEYLSTLEEEMVRSSVAERNAAMHQVEAMIRDIGSRLS